MKKSVTAIIILSLSISLFGCMNAENGAQLKEKGQVKGEVHEFQENSEADITSLVENFGSRLQQVSLLGPRYILEESMQESYGEYVSPALLEQWLNEPQNAPGRLLSSPWPERIDIVSIEKLTEDEYEVAGEVIEMTSVEKGTDGYAAKRLITLRVERIEGNWLITSANMGEYEENSAIVYKSNQYGFSFSLPDSWKNYAIVTNEWEGLALRQSSAGDVVEKGPLVAIRHPQWTAEEQRQDIPIMIFTLEQWKSLQQEDFHIGAAPMGPKELARNAKYVFALPARYNYAFPTGYEEVEKILESNPIKAIEIID